MTSLPLTIVLPVKDGEARLLETLEQVDEVVAAWDGACEVLAVDDGSTDGTAGILEAFARDHDYLRVFTHPTNQGKGAALKTAVAASRGECVVTVDADATYTLDAVQDFVAAVAAGHDAAIGNRRDPRSRFVLHPRDFAYIARRHAVGGAFSRLARAFTGVPVQDFQAGFKAYRGDVARSLFPRVDENRFAFDVEILALLWAHGHAIAEVPVTYVYKHQPSTVKLFRDGFRMIRRLLRVRRKVRALRGRR